MEENRNETQEQTPEQPVEETPTYIPRPAWQVWAARIGLVVFIIILIMYYINISRGGV